MFTSQTFYRDSTVAEYFAAAKVAALNQYKSVANYGQQETIDRTKGELKQYLRDRLESKVLGVTAKLQFGLSMAYIGSKYILFPSTRPAAEDRIVR